MPEQQVWRGDPASPESALRSAVQDGVTSGAALVVRDLRRRATVIDLVVGRVSTAPLGPPVHASTRFDLASLTKVYTATLLAGLSAADFDPDAPVSTALGRRARPWHASITFRDLLEHRAGLPSWAPLWKSGDPEEGALATPPTEPPGSRAIYSDIGYLTLRAALSGLSGEVVGALIERRVLAPWGLLHTGYCPIDREPEERKALLEAGAFAATERCPDRGLLVGEVHDENTWRLGGASTHAGLFAPAVDVARFAQAAWDLGPDAPWWAPPRTGGSHSFGWDSPSGACSSAGTLLSRRSRGHLGFTGTSIWIDPERGLACVLLTNRVHPSRKDDRIRALRPMLHDAVARCWDGAPAPFAEAEPNR